MRTYKLITLLFLAIAMPLAAQNTVTVSGVVNDDKNVPLIGATVMVKGSTNGTIADIDGKWSLTVKKGDVLQALFTGFVTEEVTVGNSTKIDFVLREDRTLLDEVVVIGYGATKKSDLTGAVTNVKMNDLKDVPAYSVDNALQGRVAGAEIMSTTGEPGATTTIRIRGTRSIEASNEPLIVVDGVVDAISDLNDINSEDIESITVLKDASSTAIYGARGANGVILVTTRQGGGSLTRPNVAFTANLGFSQLPSKLDLMNAAEFAKYRNDVSMLGSDPNNEDAGLTTPVANLAYADPLGKVGTDWIDEITQTAFYQNYALSLSGRDKANNYLISLAYNDNEGIIQGTGQQKISGRVKYTRKLYEWLSLTYNGFYTWRKQHPASASIGGTTVGTSAQYLSPLIKPNESFNPFYDGGTRFNNPRALINGTTHYRTYNTTTNSLILDLTPIKNMAIRSQFSFSNFQRHRFQYLSSELPLKAENDGGEATRQEYDEKSLSNETTVRYTFKKKRHTLIPLLGFSAYRKISNNLSVAGKGYTDDNVLWNNMTAVQDKNTYSVSSSYFAIQKLSVFARLDYNYRSRYYLTVTGRYDGASNFASNSKWAFFPSAAFRWTVSKEKFMKNVHWIDDLSLRLSAGRTGNDAISAYSSLATLNATTGSYVFDNSQPVAIYQKTVASPDLTWEKTDQYNIGIDAAFLGKRLNVTAEAYYSRTTDLLLKVQLPTQTGFSSRYENIGTTSNKGLELSIESVNIEKKNFQWLTSFTISHNTQRVEDIGTADFVTAFESLGSSKYMMYGYVKDYPLNSLWGFQYGGVWKSQEEVDRNKVTRTYASESTKLGTARYYDINHDGSLNQKDLVYLGNADPVIYGGLQNNFYWKGLKIGVYFVYSLGGKIYNISELYMAGSINTNQYRYMLGSWHPVRNPNSDIPAAGSKAAAALPSSFQVHDASYLRLKNLSVAYTFDLRKKNSNFFMREITVGVSGDNIYLWKYYNGFDPDVSSEGDSSVLRRADIGAYPKARTFMFNLNIKF
ncbi:MAG: TonB-dependent receptor [Bacteroidales bacterium]|nr:TonB-dependent receptor [Bacteroidales bacterium]